MSFNLVDKTTLEEAVISSSTGADAIKRAPIVEENTGIRCLRIGDVSNNKPYAEWGFTSADEKVIEKFSLKKDDIVIARTGNTIGVVKFIDKDTNSVFNNGLIRLKINKNKFDSKYIYYNLASKAFKDFVFAISGGTSTQPNMKINHTLKFEIANFKLVEQKAISKVLSDLDEKIEINNQINKKFEEVAQAIFKQWFVDFEFPNEDGEAYKSSGGEMVESELGKIPSGWEVIKLEDLCEIKTESEKPFENPDKIYEHFSLPACDNGKLPVIESGKSIASNKYKVDSNCILISKLNPSTKRIWDPLCNTQNAICSTEFIVFSPKDKGMKSFCYEIINLDRFTEFLLTNVTGSTGSRQRVQPKNTLNYKLVLPNKEIIQSFCSLVEPIHKKVKLTILQNDKLKNARDMLLPKLMSGEIRVPIESN